MATPVKSPEHKRAEGDDDAPHHMEDDKLDAITERLVEMVATRAAEKAAMMAAEKAADKAVEKVMQQVCDKAIAAASAKLEERLDPAFKTFNGKLADFEARLASLTSSSSQRMPTLRGQGERKPDLAGSASARASSVPSTQMPKETSRGPAVVITGFPRDSKKKTIESFVAGQIQTMPTFSHLKCFAPGVRTSMAIIRVSSKDEGISFCEAFKEKEVIFEGVRLRARGDKSREERIRNARIFNMTDFFRKNFEGDFDPDFGKGIVWGEEGALVKWIMESEKFEWMDATLEKAGYKVDKHEALAHVAS